MQQIYLYELIFIFEFCLFESKIEIKNHETIL